MEIAVEKSNKLKDGLHQGVIVDVQYRDQPFEYTDVLIEAEGAKLKAGYPTKIMKNSKLGKLLQRFGSELVEGNTIDPNKVLVGKQCNFMTMTKDSENGSFATVISDSVKPMEEKVGDK